MIYKGLFYFIAFILFLISTDTHAQNGRGNQDIATGLDYIRPYTGSGMAMSTGQYNNWLDYIDTEGIHIKGRKGLERSIHKKRHRKKELIYSFECVFHNLTDLSKSAFEQEVDIQLAALNRDFQETPTLPDHHPYADIVASPSFSFALSPRGIVDKKPQIWSYWNAVKANKTAGSNPAPVHQYINIWVIDIPDSIGSYAQYPMGPAATDGIVIDVDYFGSGRERFDQGKALTRLMASFFGVQGLYTNGDCTDDHVSDTPVHGHEVRGCLPWMIQSTCDNRPLMSDNFMSYSEDACKRYFTRGQVERMLHMIDHAPDRYSLLNTKKGNQ